MPKQASFQPTRSDVVSAVSRPFVAPCRAQGAHVPPGVHIPASVGSLSGVRAAQSRRDHHSFIAGGHVSAGTRATAEPVQESQESCDSGMRCAGACFGIAVVLLCSLTDVGVRCVLLIAEVLR